MELAEVVKLSLFHPIRCGRVLLGDVFIQAQLFQKNSRCVNINGVYVYVYENHIQLCRRERERERAREDLSRVHHYYPLKNMMKGGCIDFSRVAIKGTVAIVS